MLIDSNKDITNGTEVDEIRTYRYLFNKSLASCAVVTKPFTLSHLARKVIYGRLYNSYPIIRKSIRPQVLMLRNSILLQIFDEFKD